MEPIVLHDEDTFPSVIKLELLTYTVTPALSRGPLAEVADRVYPQWTPAQGRGDSVGVTAVSTRAGDAENSAKITDP